MPTTSISSSPDRSSISFYDESQYSPVVTSFCSSAPHRTPCSPGSTASLGDVNVAIVGSWVIGVNQRVYVAGLFYVSSPAECGSIPKFPGLILTPLVDAVLCPVSRAGRGPLFTKRIQCNLKCVGIISWTTIHQADMAPSDALVLWRLFHTLTHSIPGWSSTTRTSRCVHSAVYIIRLVS